MPDFKEKARNWIDAYTSEKTDIEREIIDQWFNRILVYYQDICDIKNEKFCEDFFRKKIVTQFFPFNFLLRSPFYLPQVKQGVNIIKEAFNKKDNCNIVIYCDKDTDGITAAAIIYLFLKDELNFPDDNLTVLSQGKDDKYGITKEAAENIQLKNPDVVIILDCGSTNKENIQSLTEESVKPLKVIIIDHHSLPDDEKNYPVVDAFINPKLLGSHFPERDLCSAGLAYKFITALAFSFTPEYESLTKIIAYNQNNENTIYYHKNGVPIEYEPDENHNNIKRVIEFSALPNTNNSLSGEKLWQEEAQNDLYFSKLNDFYEKNSEILNPAERFGILQNIRMKALTKKLKPYLSFAAIGLIADLTPVTDDNRILVYEGLNEINKNLTSMHLGLRELLKVQGLWGRPLTEQDLAYSLCPMINAPGRLGEPEAVIRIFTEKDPLAVVKHAFYIRQLNEKRKALSREAVEILINQIENQSKDENSSIIFVYNSKIHKGISGSAANQLAENYQKPALVLVDDGDSLRGSVRAYQKENVFAVLNELSHIFIQWGGHKHAGGFSLEKEKLEEFKQLFHSVSQNNSIWEENASDEKLDFSPPIGMAQDALSKDFLEKCLSFAPYGILNPHPVLSVSILPPFQIKKIGEKGAHAKIKINHGLSDIEGIWFFHGDLVDDIDKDKSVTFLAEPQRNYFQNRIKYQLKIKTVDNLTNAKAKV